MTGLPPGDWPNRQYSRSVAVPPHRWHVQHFGTGTDALLLHGAGASAHSFAKLADRFSTQFRVFVPDLPGHGFTQSPRGRARLPQVATDVSTLLRAQKIAPEVVIAHSAGAAVALQMVLSNLISPARIILLNGALEDFSGAAGVIFPIIAKMLALNPFTGMFLSSGSQSLTQARSIIRSTGSEMSDNDLGPYARLIGMRSHVDGTLSMMAQWSLSDLNRNLSKISTQTLFLHGEKDAAVAPAVAERAMTQMPNAQLRVLTGLGHLAHEEDPERVAEAIEEFLQPMPAN